MDSSLWQVSLNDILKVDIQRSDKTGEDVAAVTFKHKGQTKFAMVKKLKEKPNEMDIKDWCVTVLNTHYLIMEEEKKRGRKIPSIIVPG